MKFDFLFSCVYYLSELNHSDDNSIELMLDKFATLELRKERFKSL